MSLNRPKWSLWSGRNLKFGLGRRRNNLDGIFLRLFRTINHGKCLEWRLHQTKKTIKGLYHLIQNSRHIFHCSDTRWLLLSFLHCWNVSPTKLTSVLKNYCCQILWHCPSWAFTPNCWHTLCWTIVEGQIEMYFIVIFNTLTIYIWLVLGFLFIYIY